MIRRDVNIRYMGRAGMILGIEDLSGVAEFVVLGVATDGEVFQPTSWAEGLCNMLATMGSDGRSNSSSYARPIKVEGVAAIVVRSSLKKVDPAAFETITRFVADNHLKVRAGRGSMDAEGTGPHPVYGAERRRQGQGGWQ